MKRAFLVLVGLTLLWGCGPYRIQYVYPSRVAAAERVYEVKKAHAHGIGPLLVGGGGFFFLLQSMSPALVDYTGEVDTSRICPPHYDLGPSTVEHYHHYGQSALAALISWIGIVNWYHRSDVVYQCAQTVEQ